MPVGYLVGVVLYGTCTLVALVPLRRPRLLANVSFALGIVVNELPFFACYLIAGSTALAFAEGDIHSVGGWLAVGVGGLTVIGLGVIAARARTTRATLDEALAGARGADARAQPPRRLPYERILFAPFAFKRRDVERIKNISYGPHGKYNLLDVYRNRACPPDAPMLIHFHGGYFRIGKKSREARPLFALLASHGWVCVSANYRLGRSARFPDHLIDAKRVIAWVRAHGADYGGDPTTVFIAGSSAGGHMAAMAALTPNDAQFQPGFEQTDTSVTAAIGLYGYYGPLDVPDGRPSSPFDFAGPERPPFFVVHGDHDTSVPVEQAQALVAALRRSGPAPVVYAELRGAQHGFDLFHSIRFDLVAGAIEDFADWVR